MKVVHINFTLETGGIETMLVDILNEQCQQADMHLIVINKQIDLALLARIDSRVKIWRLERPAGSFNPLYITKLNALLLYLKPTVIHCHHHQVARLLWSRGGKRCLTIHDVQIPTNYFNRYDKLFAISNIVRKDIRQRSGFDSQRIYNGVQTKSIKPKITYSGKGLFRIVQISRLQHEKKGQHILIEALHKLIYDTRLTQLRVDFIGVGDSINYLRELTQQLNLTDYVAFVGLKTRPELYQNLNSYHLLVQPSLYEGFGLTVAEGMVAGVPVLVSAIDGPMELIDNDRLGYSFQPGDANQLADQIQKLVLNYESSAVHKKAAQARKYASEMFDVRQTAEHYLANYL